MLWPRRRRTTWINGRGLGIGGPITDATGRRVFAHRPAHQTVAHASDLLDGADALDAVAWPAGTI
jgi:hypothetical protein